jgi:hypothetical protein
VCYFLTCVNQQNELYDKSLKQRRLHVEYDPSVCVDRSYAFARPYGAGGVWRMTMTGFTLGWRDRPQFNQPAALRGYANMMAGKRSIMDLGARLLSEYRARTYK